MFIGLINIFCFPSFDHDAYMHHALHVLDAPASHKPKFGNLGPRRT